MCRDCWHLLVDVDFLAVRCVARVPGCLYRVPDACLMTCAVLRRVVVCCIVLRRVVVCRIYQPYMRYKEEQRRLNKKFAPQQAEPSAVLRPETMLAPHKSHIKDIMKQQRQKERAAFTVATSPDRVEGAQAKGADLPYVNPFIGLELAQAGEEEQQDKERLWASSSQAGAGAGTGVGADSARGMESKALPGTPTSNTPRSHASARSRPRKPPGPKPSPSKPPGPKPKSVSGTPRSKLSQVSPSPKQGVVVVTHDGPPNDPQSPLASPSVVRLSQTSKRSGASPRAGAGAGAGAGASSLSSKSGKDDSDPEFDDLGRPRVVEPKLRVVRSDLHVKTHAHPIGGDGLPMVPPSSGRTGPAHLRAS